MGEGAMKLDGEAEAGIVAQPFDPAFREPRSGDAVEAGVDFDRVEEARDPQKRVEGGRGMGGIDPAHPIGIAPSRGADVKPLLAGRWALSMGFYGHGNNCSVAEARRQPRRLTFSGDAPTIPHVTRS